MIDTTTRRPITVETDGGEWPYVIVPEAQVSAVRALLDAHQVP